MAGGSGLTGPVVIAGAGTLLLYSGIKGKGFLAAARGLLHGQAPSTAPAANTIVVSPASGAAGGGTVVNPSGSAGGSVAANQALAKMLAIANGHPDWAVGQQWADWVSLWTRESSWSATARNAGSGAFGLAQALGHGVAGSAAPDGTNEYGDQYGLSVAQAKAANSGNASAQIAWGIGYLSANPNPFGPTYGSPSAAWAHEQANGWY